MQIGNDIKDTSVFLKPVIWMETEITMQLVDVCCTEKMTTGVLPCLMLETARGRVNANWRPYKGYVRVLEACHLDGN